MSRRISARKGAIAPKGMKSSFLNQNLTEIIPGRSLYAIGNAMDDVVDSRRQGEDLLSGP
ncbi:hypothetical protein J6590_005863 [Homalodisca vitripennis]|nr:hypothetical protein J6590_005863 [Homalodisca vitripennis]